MGLPLANSKSGRPFSFHNCMNQFLIISKRAHIHTHTSPIGSASNGESNRVKVKRESNGGSNLEQVVKKTSQEITFRMNP